jgi:hypothetical protein
LHTQSDTHHQIANAFQVRSALQAGQKLARSRLVHARDGRGQPLVDITLDNVKLLLTLLDGQESHPRRVSNQVANIESGIARNEKSFEPGTRQIVKRPGSLLRGFLSTLPQLAGYYFRDTGSGGIFDSNASGCGFASHKFTQRSLSDRHISDYLTM